MAKKDADLFDRLRQVGLRKQAAKALSGVSDKTGKNAQRVARATVAELRALADEIERRLPAAPPTSDSSGKKNAAKPRPRATTRRSTSASAARTPKTGAAKPRRPPRSSTTPGAGRGSGSRPTPPPAASTERAAPTPDPAEPPPAAGTSAPHRRPIPRSRLLRRGPSAPHRRPIPRSRRPPRGPSAPHRRPIPRSRRPPRGPRAPHRRPIPPSRRPPRAPRPTDQGRIRRCCRDDLRRAHRDRRAGQGDGLARTKTKTATGAEVLEVEAATSPTETELRPIGRRVGLLATIPGPGELLALTIAAEVGPISRFPSARKLIGYAGLAPTIKQSGQSSWTGRISKAGSPRSRGHDWSRARSSVTLSAVRTAASPVSHLRWPAIEAAPHAWRPITRHAMVSSGPLDEQRRELARIQTHAYAPEANRPEPRSTMGGCTPGVPCDQPACGASLVGQL